MNTTEHLPTHSEVPSFIVTHVLKSDFQPPPQTPDPVLQQQPSGSSKADPSGAQLCLMKLYRCTYCSLAFRTTSLLLQHLYEHGGKKPLMCTLCKQSCPTEAIMRQHVDSEHGDMLRYHCRECDTLVRMRKNDILVHVERVHWSRRKEAQYTAVRLCKEVAPSGGQNLQCCPPDGPQCWKAVVYKCALCDALFHRQSDLRKHVATHVRLPLYTCCRCSQFYHSKTQLLGHVVFGHARDELFSCLYCNEAFPRALGLISHIITQHKAKSGSVATDYSKDQCDACGKTFTSVTELAKDVLYHARNPTDINLEKIKMHASIVPSGGSGSEKKNAKTVNQEIKPVHQEIKPSPSSAKIEDRSVKQELKSPPASVTIVSVDGVRENQAMVSFKCDECTQHFPEKYMLRLHALSHRRDRPNEPAVCAECGQEFPGTISLRKHLLQNHGRKHRCKVCGHTTSEQANLDRHMQTHRPLIITRRPKSVECDLCGKLYTTRVTLKRHLLKHAEGRVQSCLCDLCDKRFPSTSTLDFHRLNDHGVSS